MGEDEVLRKPTQPVVVALGVRYHRRASGRHRPHPLRVARESLVQPDVVPARDADVCPEPLVRQLMRDQTLGCGIQVIRAEDHESLRLEGDLQRVGRDDDRVLLLQIRKEPRRPRRRP